MKKIVRVELFFYCDTAVDAKKLAMVVREDGHEFAARHWATQPEPDSPEGKAQYSGMTWSESEVAPLNEPISWYERMEQIERRRR